MSDVKEEEPLDPKVEAIRKKMVRLLAVSGAIMMVGLMTVLIAIVYKLNATGKPTVAAKSEVNVPAGAKIISTAVSEDRIMLTLQRADGSKAIQIHSADSVLISQIEIREE